jgi:hypothetical protein
VGVAVLAEAVCEFATNESAKKNKAPENGTILLLICMYPPFESVFLTVFQKAGKVYHGRVRLKAGTFGLAEGKSYSRFGAPEKNLPRFLVFDLPAGRFRVRN